MALLQTLSDDNLCYGTAAAGMLAVRVARTSGLEAGAQWRFVMAAVLGTAWSSTGPNV